VSELFDNLIVYESADEPQTSQWDLAGIGTRFNAAAGTDEGNTDDGVLYATLSAAGDTYTVELFNDPSMDEIDKVAAGSAEGELPLLVELQEENDSGITGSLVFERFENDDDDVRIQVVLATDRDLDVYFKDLPLLSDYDADAGMARWINRATAEVLARVSDLYAARLSDPDIAPGYWMDNDYDVPDLRRIANPAQLREFVALWALHLACGREVQRTDGLYAAQRDYFQRQAELAFGRLRLVFDADRDGTPDSRVARSYAWHRE
jgi:hypothetical protein